MNPFLDFLIEGTERPHGEAHFWTSILSGSKEDLLGHLSTIKDIYRTAAGGKGENPLPPLSIKWNGSMALSLAADGTSRHKGGPAINSVDELSDRRFGEKAQGIIRSLHPLHQAEPLAKNGATLHTDVIQSGEDYGRNVMRDIKPNKITYQVQPREERKHIVAVHGISVGDQFLPPTAENLQKYANLHHPHIAIVGSHIDPAQTPTHPTRFPVNQAVRRVDDAIHAVNSFDDNDLKTVHEHLKYSMGSQQGPFLRAWLHSQVYNKTDPNIGDYVSFIQNHPRANKKIRSEVIEHATANAGPILRFTKMMQQVTPASGFAGHAAHYINPEQSVAPMDLDHEGLIYQHGGKTWKAVSPAFSRQVVAAGDYEGMERYADSLLAKPNINESVDDSFMKRRAEQIIRDQVKQHNSVEQTPKSASITPIKSGTMTGKKIQGEVNQQQKQIDLDNDSTGLLKRLVDHVTNGPYPATTRAHATATLKDHMDANKHPDPNIDAYAHAHGYVAFWHGLLSQHKPYAYYGSELHADVAQHIKDVSLHHTGGTKTMMNSALDTGFESGRILNDHY